MQVEGPLGIDKEEGLKGAPGSGLFLLFWWGDLQ